MPHVKDFADKYESQSEIHIVLPVPWSTGELNACITAVCKKYLRQGEMGYARMNDVLGALEGAKLEFYRLVVSPHEDRKRKENGDAWKL